MLQFTHEERAIENIWAREVIDSRGNPTVEVEVVTDGGFGRAIVPSGASTGSYEALELRDEDERFHGKGVRTAVANVNNILSDTIMGMDVTDQHGIDLAMIEKDGTDGKTELGANAILGVSMACACCAADCLGVQLYEYLGGPHAHLMPIPMSNVLNAGVHGASSLELQEFMVMPTGAKTFAEGIRAVCETYHELKGIVAKKYGNNATGVGDEGGYSPPMTMVNEPLDMLVDAIDAAGYSKIMSIALDAAASEFYSKKEGTYTLEGKKISPSQLVERYVSMTEQYPVFSLEDPFFEDDFESFATLTDAIGKKVQIVGDDLYVSNPRRIIDGIEKRMTNALLLKVNQIGTVSEAFDAATLAMRNGWNVVVSHRSGETEDTFIADLSVALNCGQIKTGAPCRSERTSKYNRLLRIEESMRRY